MASICTMRQRVFPNCEDCPHYKKDEDYGMACFIKQDLKNKRTKLTDKEFDAIAKLTSNTKLDTSFDITDGIIMDAFTDFDNNNSIVDLQVGLNWLYEGIAYPVQHDGLTKEQGELIYNLFVEFNVPIPDNYKEWLLKDEEL